MDANKFEYEELEALLAAERELSAARKALIRAAERYRDALSYIGLNDLYRSAFTTFEAYARAQMDDALVASLTSIIPPSLPTPVPSSLKPQGDIDDFVEYDPAPRRYQTGGGKKRKRVKA